MYFTLFSEDSFSVRQERKAERLQLSIYTAIQLQYLKLCYLELFKNHFPVRALRVSHLQPFKDLRSFAINIDKLQSFYARPNTVNMAKSEVVRASCKI